MGEKETRLIKQSSLNLFDESQDLAEFASGVLGDIKAKLNNSILKASGTALEDTVSVIAMGDLLKEVDKHLASAERSLERHLRGTFDDIYQLQFESIIEQASTFEKASKSGIGYSDIQRLQKIKPRLSGGVIRATYEGTLKKLSSSLDDLRPAIQRKISTNILTGGSYGELIHEIEGAGIDKGVFKTVEHRARAIAITETTNVHNFARYDSLIAANRALPEGRKLDMKWVALLDGKTSARCRSLHGQVKKQGEDFQSSDGWRGKMPAAHPHCRSEIVPYRREWDGIFEELEAELRAQVQSSK